jgi:hypothetical protein
MVSVFAPSLRTDIPLVPDNLVRKYEKQVFEIDQQVDKLTQAAPPASKSR